MRHKKPTKLRKWNHTPTSAAVSSLQRTAAVAMEKSKVRIRAVAVVHSKHFIVEFVKTLR